MVQFACPRPRPKGYVPGPPPPRRQGDFRGCRRAAAARYRGSEARRKAAGRAQHPRQSYDRSRPWRHPRVENGRWWQVAAAEAASIASEEVAALREEVKALKEELAMVRADMRTMRDMQESRKERCGGLPMMGQQDLQQQGQPSMSTGILGATSHPNPNPHRDASEDGDGADASMSEKKAQRGGVEASLHRIWAAVQGRQVRRDTEVQAMAVNIINAAIKGDTVRTWLWPWRKRIDLHGIDKHPLEEYEKCCNGIMPSDRRCNRKRGNEWKGILIFDGVRWVTPEEDACRLLDEEERRKKLTF